MRDILISAAVASASIGSLASESFGGLALDAANESPKIVEPAVEKPRELFYKLPDGNLIGAFQRGKELVFGVTRSGYGSKSIEMTVLGSGAKKTAIEANVFIELKPLEVLAFLDNDWTKLYNQALSDQSDTPQIAVDPALIRLTLAPLVTYVPGVRCRTLSLPFLDLASNTLPQISKPDLDVEVWCSTGKALPSAELPKSVFRPSTWRPAVSESVYLHVNIDGDVLIQMQEIDGALHISKTSSGYAVGGFGIHATVAGFSKEIVEGNVYFEISPGQAKAWLEGKWEKLYEAALRQDKIIEFSVNPELVWQTFKPGSSDSANYTPAKLTPVAESSVIGGPKESVKK